MKKLTLLLIAITCWNQIWGEILDGDSIAMSYDLEEVVVESRKSEVGSEAVQLIASVSKLDIEQMAIRTIDDVLRMVPGVDVRSRGVGGGQTDISMRGGTFDQVMILVNGIAINDVQTGHYSMNLPVDIALIERIEVLQGAAVEVFGGNALSGAINFVTKVEGQRTKGREWGQYMGKMAGGMYGYVAPSFAGRNGWEKFDIAYSANYSQSNGYSAPGELTEKEKKALENSDYRMANVWFQGSYHNQSNFGRNDVDIQIGAQYKDIGAGMFYGFGSQDQFDATRTAFGSAKYSGQWDGWMVEAQTSYRANYDRYEWHRGERKYGNFHFSQTAATSLKGGYVYDIGKTMVGIEIKNSNIHSTNIGDTINPNGQIPNVDGFELNDVRVLDLVKGANRLECSWFGSQTFTYERLTANLSLNGIWSKDFGHNLGGGMNLGYEYMSGSNVYLNASRTMRMPTFTDLYYDAGNQLGDKYLKPEKAWTFAVGTNFRKDFGRAGSINAEVSAYYRIGQDIIDWINVSEDTKRPFHASNLDRVDGAGVEVGIHYRWNEWLKLIELSYAYTYMDLGDYSVCSRYLDYLSHKAILRIGHRIAKLKNSEFGASWALTYQKREGYYNNVEGEVQKYGGVLLLDGEVYWRDRRFKAGIQCSNMTNRRFYDYGGVLKPGAWAEATFSFKL